jgi:hypothetical protein
VAFSVPLVEAFGQICQSQNDVLILRSPKNVQKWLTSFYAASPAIQFVGEHLQFLPLSVMDLIPSNYSISM